MRISRSRRPCLPWTGHTNSVSGHGQRWDAAVKKVRGAHVMAWENANGRHVEPGEVVRHSCNNPPCVEPTHLLIGTHKDNHNDSVKAGTAKLPPRYQGESHPGAKLTDAQVADLRGAYTGKRGERAALARKFGITKTRVGQLLDKEVRQ